jgi:hypothetical protein
VFLRSDHQVLEDLKRVIIIDQGVEAVTGSVLDFVFVANPLCQWRIEPNLVAEFAESIQKGGVAGLKSFAALLTAGVEQAAISKNEAHRLYGLVAVLVDTTTHTDALLAAFHRSCNW